jgi:hypothetical protein
MSRLFVNTVAEIREGASMADLDAALTELVAQIRESGRGGKLIYTLEIRPASKGDVKVLAIQDRVTVKAPNAERGTTFMYPSDDNSLSRRDPRQPELPALRNIKHAPADAAAVVSVSAQLKTAQEASGS